MRGWKVWVEPSASNWRTRWAGKYGVGQQTFTYRADSKDYADEKRREFQLRDIGKEPPPRAAPALILGKFAEEYLTYSKAEKSHRTYRNFDVPAVKAIRDYLGDSTRLDAIQPSQIQAWKHSLGHGTTSSMLFRAVQTFFNYAVSMKHLKESPAKGLKKPQESGGGRALSDAELTALMSHAEEALLKAGAFSLNTLLRISEVTAFRWEWTSEVGGEMLGRLPWEMRKARRHRKKDCIFPINAQARASMGEPQKSGLVFPWSPITIQHQLIRARKLAGLPEDVTFHCFRHTGATRYLANAGHMEDLLDNGLWSDPRSLLRYVHVSPETMIPRFAAIKYPDFAPLRPLPKEDGPLS